MTRKDFIKSVTNEKGNVLERLLDLLKKTRTDYCIIGGLAVNAYCEPVVSLDLDLVIIMEAIEPFLKAAEKIFKIKRFVHSINLSSPKTDLRVQIQTDLRYQNFLSRSSIRKVLGYRMRVAALEDILKGKIWAYADEKRRKSKRQKDLADIFRIVETYPYMIKLLPEELKDKIIA